MPSPKNPGTRLNGFVRLWHRRRITLVVVVACVSVIGASSWRSHLLQVGQASQKDQNPRFFDQVKRGLGTQVQFAPAGSSSDKVLASVESVDRFIGDRSGLAMSADTKKRLASVEEETLNGELPMLKVDRLADILTDTALERFATISDNEIYYATRTLSFGRGSDIFLRASGEGHLQAATFVKYAKSFRDQSRNGDATLRSALRPAILEEVTGRLSLFRGAVPSQFGGALDEGVTPLQALLISYSLVSDDYLAGSQDDLNKTMAQLPRRESKSDPYAMRAFGPYGRLFSTPVNLILNRNTMDSFLNRVEEGRNQK